MHENTFTARLILRELANGFKKGQTFYIANRSADFTKHEINLILANFDEIFDFIGHMWDHLNGFSQIIPAAFFFQYRRIDPTGRHRIGLPRRHARETFIMAQI